MASTQQILIRIDEVLRENKNLQRWFLILAVTLFLCGIAAILFAIFTNQLIWTIPSVFTSFFLGWPIKRILCLREKNIALATVPILITKLPEKEATKAIQKLIEKLYE